MVFSYCSLNGVDAMWIHRSQRYSEGRKPCADWGRGWSHVVQAKEYQELPEPGRGKEESSLQSSKGDNTLISNF